MGNLKTLVLKLPILSEANLPSFLAFYDITCSNTSGRFFLMKRRDGIGLLAVVMGLPSGTPRLMDHEQSHISRFSVVSRQVLGLA
jgi:hypothetical protein